MLKLQFRDQPGNFVKLSVATVTLGRDEGNDVVIDSPSVSDFHAEITTDAQYPLIVDLLSANGTFVNERRISSGCQLRAWDVIRLGTVELEVTDPNTHRPDDWALRSESDLLASQFHALQPNTVVGRDPACDLTIDSNLLSRRHARLLIEADHLKVIDLGSANGTFLNGEKIEEADAWPGDELRFDKQCFIVVGPTPPQVSNSDSAGDRTVVREAADAATIIAEPVEPVEPVEPAQAVYLATENNVDLPSDSTDPDDGTVLVSSEETVLYVAPPPVAVLSEICAGEESRNITLEGDRQRLGRGDDCDVVLADKSVSKLHAEFIFEHDGWLVRDLGSSNGVQVNGESVDEIHLQAGDRVQLGRLEFEFGLAGGGVEFGEPVTMIFDPGAEQSPHDPAAGKFLGFKAYLWICGLFVAAAVLWFTTR